MVLKRGSSTMMAVEDDDAPSASCSGDASTMMMMMMSESMSTAPTEILQHMPSPRNSSFASNKKGRTEYQCEVGNGKVAAGGSSGIGMGSGMSFMNPRQPLAAAFGNENENISPYHQQQYRVQEKKMRRDDDFSMNASVRSELGAAEFHFDTLGQMRGHIQSMQQYHEAQTKTFRSQSESTITDRDGKIASLTALTQQLLERNTRLEQDGKVHQDENRILKKAVGIQDHRQRELTAQNQQLQGLLGQASQYIQALETQNHELLGELRHRELGATKFPPNSSFGPGPPHPPVF
jgi:hypothetical protein